MNATKCAAECGNSADIGPWCVRCCPSSRKAVVRRVGLPPAPVMPAVGRRYRASLRARVVIAMAAA